MSRRRAHVLSVRGAVALALCVVGVCGAWPASARDDGTRASQTGPTARVSADPRPQEIERERTAGSALRRLGDRLRALPLRPVRIGRTPRRPTDPDPGMGIVLRIPF